MDDSRTPWRILNDKMIATRSRGRPRERWEDEVIQDIRNLLGIILWRVVALDRDEFRKGLDEARLRYRTVVL